MQTGISKQGDYAEYSSQAGIDKTVQNNLIIPINGPASLYSFIRFRTRGTITSQDKNIKVAQRYLLGELTFEIPDIVLLHSPHSAFHHNQ